MVLPLIFDHFFGPVGGDLFPIYSGMILLSGIIVICTKVVLEEINGLKKRKMERFQKKIIQLNTANGRDCGTSNAEFIY